MSSPHPNQKLALLCTLHTTSRGSRARVQSLLTDLTPQGPGAYYRSASSQCTTWSYFTPSTRSKAPSQLVPKTDHESALWGMEIYADKQALSTQMDEGWFQNLRGVVEREGLYDVGKGGKGGKGEDLVAWYPVRGFVAREGGNGARPFGEGVLVMVAVFTCKGTEEREKMLDVIGKYTDWVKENEPGVLTYCTMVRPKEPTKVLLFERYRDQKALGAHGSTKEFKAMFKGIAPEIEVKQTKLQEFTEIDSSFVGNTPGEFEQKVVSKL